MLFSKSGGARIVQLIRLPYLLALGNLDPDTPPAVVLDLYQTFKANSQLNTPDGLDMFGDRLDWHSHENTIFRNLDKLDPNAVEFTQSVSDQNFVTALLGALADEKIVAAPYE